MDGSDLMENAFCFSLSLTSEFWHKSHLLMKGCEGESKVSLIKSITLLACDDELISSSRSLKSSSLMLSGLPSHSEQDPSGLAEKLVIVFNLPVMDSIKVDF